MKKLILPFLAVLMMTACTETNPLLGEWNTPFEIPPFEQVRPKHYLPAYIKAMEVHSAEIDAITSNPEPATFENTIVAYSNSGELLSRVSAVFGSASGVKSNEEIKAIARELSPLTSAHSNKISLNEELFARIKEVYDNRDNLGLEEDQMRLLTEIYKGFARNGANLPADKKEELKKINTELSANQLAFGQNLLKETEWTFLVENEEDLAGLSEAQINTAATRAQQAGKEGWLFGLDNPSVMPFLQSADNRDLRITMLDAYLNRCNNGNEYDNNQVIKNLITLRLQKANLLGYEDYAAYVLEERMAKNADAVYSLLNQLWTPALEVAKAELADIEALAAKDGITEVVAADWRYYFEKSMQSKYNISDEELRPYFQLENVREGIFFLANKLFGITFEQLDNVPLPHHEAVAFECKEADGTTLGILFMDMFSRPGEKRGGAWCGGFRSQYYKDGVRVLPLVTIVGNFTRPSGDKPALLSTDETETFFHEFGHALASLFCDVRYKGLGRMTRDFVELPSQIMEHWVFEPELLKEYAKHYETGEVIPAELIEKLDKAGKYGQGFATVEYLAASFLDMDFHVLKSIPEDLEPIAFENKVLGDRGLLPQIPSRYRSPYFNHTFGGGYTAGYYSYIWAEVLDCDAYEAFVETGDIFNQEVALKFRKEILERPGVDEAMNLYVNFRGREPGIEPLLKKRGLN
ncbi:MAG: M3 family metallopeptidase [Bacteroidales bacterium]|nr:M3 family metallopeptidase [Bacteroidales bacterium]